MADHVWLPHPANSKYLLLQGYTNALVRVEPMPANAAVPNYTTT